MNAPNRAFLLTAFVAAGILACGGAETDVASGPPGGVEPSFEGTYAVRGSTVETVRGNTRQIEGTVILSQTENGYTATFSMNTNFPTSEGPVPADVIGKGEGQINAGRLVGEAETQLVMSTVPGIDTGFAFVPRFVGPKIVSTMVALLDEDGVLVVETENRAADGEQYAATKTTVRGSRIGPADLGALPDVAAGPR